MIKTSIGIFDYCIENNTIISLSPTLEFRKICDPFYSYVVELIEQSCQNIIKSTNCKKFKLPESEFLYEVDGMILNELSKIDCIKEPLLKLGVFQYVA